MNFISLYLTQGFTQMYKIVIVINVISPSHDLDVTTLCVVYLSISGINSRAGKI